MTTCRKPLFLLLFLFSCLTISSAYCQEAPGPQTLEELKSVLESEMNRQHVAGLMLTLVSHDSILYTGGLGYADLENKVAVVDQHLFRQASITKLFTALGVLNLVKEGKLELDFGLREVAPEVFFRNEWEETNPITIAQLMEHSTGFSDKSLWEEFNFEHEQVDGLEALEVFREHMVSRWRPGERFSYSGVNYAILAYVIEKVSGKTFQEYMWEKVFLPLGMSNANVSLAGEEPGVYSKGYIWNGSRFQIVPHQPQYNPGYGSLNASATDFAHALQAYLHDWQMPAKQFLSEQLLNRSEKPATYLSARAGLQSTYALGNESRELGGIVFRGHSGSIAGYLSSFHYSREVGVGFAFSINTFNPDFHNFATSLIVRFITRNVGAPTSLPAYPLQTSAVEPFLGYYRLSSSSDRYMGYFQGLQNTFKLERHEGVLQANSLLGRSMTWKAADSCRLLFTNEWAKDPRIIFLRNGMKEPVIVEDTLFFEKVSIFKAWTPIGLLVLCLLSMISTFVFGLASSIRFFLSRKKGAKVYLLRLSPALAMLSLVLCLWVVSRLSDRIAAGVPISDLAHLWMLGRYSFALYVLTSFLLLVLCWKDLKSRLLRGYLAAVHLCGGYLLAVLILSHWY